MHIEIVKVQRLPRPEWAVVLYGPDGREVRREEEFWTRRAAERYCASLKGG